METRRDVFRAIADPIRRDIIVMLAKEPLNLNTIADNFEVSRQAVSVHVKILEECGLIVITQQGRERLCEARIDKLGEVTHWVEHCRQFWAVKFKSLDKYLAKVQADKKKKK